MRRSIPEASYLVVVRNPISRTLSAFNWRYKLVVEQDAQRHRFPGEYEALSRHGSLNSLAGLDEMRQEKLLK